MNHKRQKTIQKQRAQRIRKVRSTIKGTAQRPRLVVSRSLTNISAQIVDDVKGHTLTAVTQKELGKKKVARIDAAVALGKLVAKKAQKAGIDNVVFDRRHYKYHGRVKAFADAAREAGLKF